MSWIPLNQQLPSGRSEAYVKHLTHTQTSINTERVFSSNLTFMKICYKCSGKRQAVLGRIFKGWCKMVSMNNIGMYFLNNLIICQCFYSQFLILWVCFLLLVYCTSILRQVFFLSSSGVFLMTYHGFNHGVMVFYPGGLGVLCPALDTYGFVLVCRAVWAGV